MKKRIYFRADGSSKIGLGHVIRSLALADMLREEFDCRFIIRTPLETLKNQILEVCNEIIELPATEDNQAEASLLTEKYLQSDDIIVLDGYHFDKIYQQIIQNKSCKLVFIDDIQHTRFTADAVVNHAPGLTPAQYDVTENTRLCLGAEYALLRPPFLRAVETSRHIEEIKTIFVCFGGADFNNLSLRVLKLFSAFAGKKYNIHMVLGGANDFKNKVKEFARTITDFEVNLYENLSAEDMVAVMQESDCAIVPASSIMYEVLAVRMPVIGGYYVDNQVNIYHGFNNTELIEGVGNLNDFTDYEAVLQRVQKQDVSEVINKQATVGFTNARKNFLQLFKSI